MILVLEGKIIRYTKIKYGQFPDIVMMWEHKTSCSSQHLAHVVSGLQGFIYHRGEDVVSKADFYPRPLSLDYFPNLRHLQIKMSYFCGEFTVKLAGLVTLHIHNLFTTNYSIYSKSC